MASETIYDGRALLAHNREIDRSLPITAKIEPPLSELRALVKNRWSDLLPQSRKGIESAIASLEAALELHQHAAKLHCVSEAKKGELGPRRILRSVE
jgi:hypothetical protein